MSDKKFHGKRVWIVGASSGIGAALAEEMLGRGATVAISARREEELATVAAGRMTVVPVDVTDAEAVQKAAAQVRRDIGEIDMVVLNAGTWTQLSLADIDPDDVRKHLDVNVMGMVNGVAAVIGPMLKARRGTIAVVASVAGYRGFPGAMAYGATKAAQINFLEAIRPEAAASGVRVVTINPGFVRTPMTASNRFRMPFVIEADQAARSIADGLAGRRQEVVFPLPMAITMKIARLLPVRVWTAVSAKLQGK